MAFLARYPGVCPACDERFEAGEPVRFDADGVVHESCDAVPRDLTPAEVCTHCWLEKPCGCDD